MKIPFFDLKKVNKEIENEIEQAIKKVIDSGWYILGNEGEKFENNLKTSLSPHEEGYVIGCNSGTDALILSLLAAGVKPGDEVITVSHTAIPTITAICSAGAVPVFVDIEPDTWLMDISQVAEALTPKTKAVIPVHLYGNMVNVVKLREILNSLSREDVAIVEDVAQAHGAELNGLLAGTIGRFGAFSFYPSKNIGALGDAGAVFCRSADDVNRLRMLRNYGQKDRYKADLKRGLNSRLDEIQAAILNIKLRYLAKWNQLKSQQMAIYRKELSALPITFQKVSEGCSPGWHLCILALDKQEDRNALIAHYQSRGIQVLIHYPTPTHLQEAFCSNAPVKLPLTESLTERIVSIPLNSALTHSEQQEIINVTKEFFR